MYIVKFIFSEKATKFCKISIVDLSYVVPVKSTVEISQNFVAFSEYMNFTYLESRYLIVRLDARNKPDSTSAIFSVQGQARSALCIEAE